jgi:hypothetical protein
MSVNEIYIVTLIGIFSAITGYLVSFFITKTKFYNLGYEKGKNEFTKSLQKIQKKAISDYKSDDGYQAMLTKEYLMGKMDGEKEERLKFCIQYSPYTEEYDSLFKHRIDVGYEMQLFYQDMPIGVPTRRITAHHEKFKEEYLEKLIGKVFEELESITNTFINKNIQFLRNPEIKKYKSKKN